MGSTEILRLIQAMRQATPGRAVNVLALECILHCAEQERTMADLMVLTGASNGRLSEALRGVTVHWSSKGAELIEPPLNLLKRRKIKGARGYRFSLTRNARHLLDAGKGTPPQ